MLHGGVGKTLRESRFDVKARLAAGFFDAFELLRPGDAHALVKTPLKLSQFHERFDLRTRPVHEHHAHAHARNEAHVHHKMVQKGVVGDDFTRKTDHERAPVVQVHVRRCGAQPGDPLHVLVVADGLGLGRIVGV